MQTGRRAENSPVHRREVNGYGNSRNDAREMHREGGTDGRGTAEGIVRAERDKEGIVRAERDKNTTGNRTIRGEKDAKRRKKHKDLHISKKSCTFARFLYTMYKYINIDKPF